LIQECFSLINHFFIEEDMLEIKDLYVKV